MTQTLQNTTSLTPITQTTNFRLIKGYEMEINNAYIDQTQRALRNAGIRYVLVTGDVSENVDCEVIFPPLRIDTIEQANKYIKPVQDVVESLGGRIRQNCGGHVHVGMKPLIDMTDDEFNEEQIRHWNLNTNPTLSSMNANYISPNVTLGALLPFELIKSAIMVYGYNQDYISSMLPESRRNHRWARPINDITDTNTTMGRIFSNATNVQDLINASLIKGKAVNCEPYNSYQTIEFRQGASTLSALKLSKWCQVLEHLFQSSHAFRINYNTSNNSENVETRTVEVETPLQHGNGRSFVARVYDMCRNHNNGEGATIEEIMNVTNAGDQNIRSRISELRRAYGQGAIITHTQQANNHVYGDGQIYCRYQILHRFEKVQVIQNETSNSTLVNDADYNFFIGLDAELKRWIDARIIQLA